MSASIYYQPIKGKHLHIGAPSSFLGLLSRVLKTTQPFLITDQQARDLGVAAMATENDEHRAALLELEEAAYQNGEIRVWAEY